MLSFVVSLDIVLFVNRNKIMADEANRFPKVLSKDRLTIFLLPKKRTFFGNNYYQPYKLFCKAGKIFMDICWTLTAFDNYILIISANTEVYFFNILCQ